MTARYSGNTNSKSLNARAAERDGRFPASAWPARLGVMGLFRGVTAADIKTAVETSEWHHVGSFAAQINYYGLAEIFAARRALRTAMAARKAARRGPPKFPALLHERASITYTDWEGAGRRKTSTEWKASGARVTQISATMVEIDGEFQASGHKAARRVVRKKLGGNWLTIAAERKSCP